MVSVIAFGWFVLLALAGGRFASRVAQRPGPVRDVPRAGRGGQALLRAGLRVQRALVAGAARPLAGIPLRVLHDVRRRRGQARAHAQLDRDLPSAIDLLAVAVGAGWTPLLALELVIRWAPASVARAFSPALEAFALGFPLGEAYTLAARRAPPIAPLTDLLAASAALGSPIVPALGRLAYESRLHQRRRAEARARTVPVRLLFPLVFLVLPAFVLVTIVPAVATGWRGA